MTRCSVLLMIILASPYLALLMANQTEPGKGDARSFARLPSVAPVPAENPTTPAKVALGKQLFFDPRLSGDNNMSCATCHVPEKGFGDGRARSLGAGGKLLNRNTPTVLNVSRRRSKATRSIATNPSSSRGGSSSRR